MSTFAKAQLLKYGWTEGKGLGKNENGITEALKPKLKFDNAGVGHKENFSNEWWAAAYNKAASSITVDSKTNGVSISVSKKDTVHPQPKESSKKKKSGQTYGNFLKTSVLYGDNLVDENNSNKVLVESTESDVIHTPLTDEELFKACGGRTAHKGARHGLSLSGKLDRIAQQEKKLLASSIFRNSMIRSEKRGRDSQDEYEMDSNANTILPLVLSSSQESSGLTKSKSSRKKQRRRINDLTHKLNTLCNMNDTNDEAEHNASDEKTAKKELKRKRSKDRKQITKCDNTESIRQQEIYNILLPVSKEVETPRNKRKKTHTKNILDQSDYGECQEHNKQELNHASTHNSKKKKSKRKRSESHQGTNTTAIEVDEEVLHVSQSKKSKKSSKKKGTDFKSLERNDDVSISRYKFEVGSTSTEIPAISNNAEKYNDSDSSSSVSKKMTTHLNTRIKKKKLAKLHKKQTIKLNNITESLKAVHFDTEESSKTNNA